MCAVLFSFTTILAIIGLMIGIASLIVVTSIMNGFEKELENRILGVIPHSVIYADAPINNYDQVIEEIKSEFEMIDDFSEYDKQSESQNSKEDDLLQIPAFLRRQAN